MRRRKIKKIPIIFTFLTLILLVFGSLYFFKEYFKKDVITEKPTELDKEDDIIKYSGTMTIAGNVLINSNMWSDTITNDGKYDFKFVFEKLKNKMKVSNLNLYSQESILGGKELGTSSFSVYNSPLELGDAMIDLGFNMVSLANYQSFDKGTQGIANTITYLNDNKIAYSGISSTLEARLTNNTITKNGIKYGLLSYTVGTDTTLTDTYSVNVYSPELAKKDVEAIEDSVDVIIVSIDWSNITSVDITDAQKEIATYLSELGVNIVIGNTGYSVQPIEMKNNTLVFYSLGNLLSGHTSIDSRISMVVDFGVKVTKDGEKKTVEFNNINAMLTFAYNQYKTNYKVIPFEDITTELPSYQTYYDKYNTTIKSLYSNVNVYELGE